MHKWPALREQFAGVELHLIGPLQTNKVREAVALFDCIETVDRPKLAAALAAEIGRQNRAPKLLIQVNTGLEPQKAGVAPADAETFLEQCRREFGLTIAGLMCIPPFDGDPLPHFETLAALRGRLGLTELSMGMSADFETAIRAGRDHGARRHRHLRAPLRRLRRRTREGGYPYKNLFQLDRWIPAFAGMTPRSFPEAAA